VGLKTRFITGSNSGIGRRVTECLLERGDRVAATSRRPTELVDLAAKYGEQRWTAQLDMLDPLGIRQTVQRAFAELGHVDVMFSNAGYLLAGAAEELTDSDISRQIDTNLMGPIRLVKAALPHLRAQGGGHIVQLSSMGGQITTSGTSAYNATKWGVEGFIDAVAREVAAFGIEVTLVEPGNVPTNFSNSMTLAPQVDAYTGGPVAQLRQFLMTPGAVNAAAVSDLTRVAEAIIESTQTTPAPRRLALGSDAYQLIRQSLADRLSALDAQRNVAYGTDAVQLSVGT